MLGRALLPLLRQPKTLRLPATQPASLITQSRRCYARDRGSKGPLGGYRIPAGAPPSRFAQARRPEPNDRSPQSERSQADSAPDYAVEQDEFQASSRSKFNTAPQSPGAGASAGPVAGSRQSSSRDFSGVQDEFDTSTDSTSNTTPQSPGASTHRGAPVTGTSNAPLESARPIPDLTQGIPSTLEAELSQAKLKTASPVSLNVTEDSSQPSSGGGSRGRGDIPQSPYVSSLERKSNRIANIVYAIIAGGFFGGTIFLGRNWESAAEEKKHSDAPNGWGIGLFYNRALARMSDMLGYYRDPAFTKLLPDEDADPNLRAPFTLVLSLEDLLMHSEWSRKEGWRIAKRPGLDYFIRYLSQYYEIVLWTSQPSMIADPVIRKLDPYRIMRFPLFREATLYKNGEYIKDLSYLNRDLSKVLIIDTEQSHTRNQPENAVVLPKWQGDPKDQTLIALLPFLEYVATMGFDDTRKVLKSFEGTYIPEEFHKREKLLRERFEAEEKAKSPQKRGGGFGLGSLFSTQPKTQGADEASSQGSGSSKMIWDQIRERGQKQFQAIDKEIRENGEKWLAEMSAEEKRYQEESMNSMKSGFTGWFNFGREGKS